MTTPSEPSLVQLWLHGGLDLSEQLQKEPPECPAENVSAHPTPRRDRTLAGPTVPPGGLYLTRLWYEDERLNG